MLSTRLTTSTNCTLAEALPLAHVETYALTIGDACTLCCRTPARLKVLTFTPAGRDLRLAGEHRACTDHEQLLADAAHASVADQRHLVRTVLLHGHPRWGHGLSSTDICGAAA